MHKEGNKMLYYFYMMHMGHTHNYIVQDPEIKDGILYCTIVGRYIDIPKYARVEKYTPRKLIVKHEEWMLKECDVRW